jgi:pyridoxamine 5'-phosphate oxidase
MARGFMSVPQTVDPLAMLQQWYEAAHVASPLKHAGAACVSTVDDTGAPDARFVDVKEISAAGIVFGTALDSAKAQAIRARPDVALTFWWDHAGRQVRVVGTAEPITDAQADALFRERTRDAQIVAWTSQQSASLEEPAALEAAYRAAHERFAGKPVPRPPHWGGYCVVPRRIEFLTFSATRLHERLLFRRVPGGWRRSRLQP